MELVIRIATDNAAFEDDSYELGRVIREAADRIDSGESLPFKLRDVNGNTVGTVAGVDR